MKLLIYALALSILIVVLGSCGGGSSSPDVVPDDTPTPTPDTSSAMPGTGVVVQPARATWTTGYFQEAVYSLALESLGYEVFDHTELENPDFYQAVGQGDVTFWANGWFPAHQIYSDLYEPGASIAGTVAAFGALQGYIVDKAGADEFNITSVADFKRDEVRQAYDADGDGKAELLSCVKGWGCSVIIGTQLDTFGMREHIEEQTPIYSEGIRDIVARFRSGEHVFFYTWTPHWWANQLTPGTDVVWIEAPGVAHPLGLSKEDLTHSGIEGCVNDPCFMGFMGSDIKVVANNQFIAENPAAAKLFEVMAIPLGDISTQNNRMENGETTQADIDNHAREWIASNRFLFDTWLEQARQAAS